MILIGEMLVLAHHAEIIVLQHHDFHRDMVLAHGGQLHHGHLERTVPADRHNLSVWLSHFHAHGGRNYSIFLDENTLTLFAVIEIEDEELWARGADTDVNRKWWDFMADIMETNPDNSPVSVDLPMLFHLD